MHRWIKRGVIAVAALAALYVVALGVGGGLMLAWALTPGRVDWSGANQPLPKDPFEIGYRGDPKTALGLDFETIHYQTELGPAEAWLVPAARPSRTWAVFVHGIGGIRENGYRQLAILHEAGIPTLLITYRNDAGAPAGQPPFYSFGLTEWRDLDAAVGWILDQPTADRVVLVAESMGGAIAGQFLKHSDRADRVAALVLDAPALDFTAVADWVLGQFMLPLSGQMAAVATQIASRWSPEPLANANVLETVVDFPGPVFVAHGSGDQLVPLAMSGELVAQRRGPTTFLKTSAIHLRSFKEEPEKYRQQLLAFLRALPPP